MLLYQLKSNSSVYAQELDAIAEQLTLEGEVSKDADSENANKSEPLTVIGPIKGWKHIPWNARLKIFMISFPLLMNFWFK